MPATNGNIRSRSPDAALPAEEILPVNLVNTCFGLAHMVRSEHARPAGQQEPDARCGLSGRAINVLKILADEIMGEVPSRDAWVPSEDLMRKITVERLSIARNCGPRTVDEIIRWAAARGVTVQPVFHAGKSLSETWRDLSARFASGELTKAELAEALQKSVRRKSTKVPVPVQRILLKYLSSIGD
jgi:hypothetical protein